MLDIPCVIFAGGKSSRMGEDKSLLPFGNFPTLIEYQLNKFQKYFKNVYISSKDNKKFDFLQNKNLIIIDKNNTYAPTVGFQAVFENLKCDFFFATSVDSPFINNYIINQLIQNDKTSADATIAKTPLGIEPLCGIYHISLLDKFSKMIKCDNHKLGYLLKNSNTIYVEFEESNFFYNMNTQEEYIKALNIMQEKI